MIQENVLTLACPIGDAEEAVAVASAELRGLGVGGETVHWLVPGVACDLSFGGAPAEDVESAVRTALGDNPVDVACQPVAGRRKRLLVADMEATIIANEMLDELADFAGVHDEVVAITARAMAGEIDFPGALRRRANLLTGQPSTIVDRARERIRINPGAARLVATMRSNGAFTALVSGGFSVFVEEVKRRLGFDTYRANELVIEDGRLTGDVGEPILGRDAKVEALTAFCRQLAVDPSDAVTVGDGANDLGMLLASGLGVAFHAKPAVATAARFSVRHGDLRTLLYYQGYREAEIVRG